MTAEHPASAGNGEAPEEEAVPAATEQLHLPGPSYLPVVVAAGVTLALVGVITTVVLVALGLLITVVAVVLWAREARAETAELPLEHG
jgi:hypothetical protein